MRTALPRIGVALWAIAVGFVECALTTAAFRQESTAASHIVSQTTTREFPTRAVRQKAAAAPVRCKRHELAARRSCRLGRPWAIDGAARMFLSGR
jgi:hypothetical protein